MQNGVPEIPGIRIEGAIGEGATSTVFRASRGERRFALKLFHNFSGANFHRNQQAFLREAATIAKLVHKGLVHIFEVGETERRPYLLMEFVEGESLEQRLRRAPMTEAEFIDFSRQILPIVDYIHCRGVIHKDLKPENIMFNSNGEVKLIDFGFATEVGDSVERESPSTDMVGTLLYAAPEQAGTLKRAVDSRADLYALGGVFFRCLTGRHVFETDSAHALLTLHLNSKPISAAVYNHSLHPVLSAIIEKLLAKDPDDRYQSARGLLYDLENFNHIISHQGLPSLGTQDKGVRAVEVPFVGRKSELNTLLETVESAQKGNPAIIFIAGEGGSGKTRLVRELLNSPKSREFLVLAGKGRQFGHFPFGPLREAVDNLFARLNRGSAAERMRITDGLKGAAGDLAAVIARLSPRLKEAFADAPYVAPLDGNAEQERFYLKVAEFFVSIPRFVGPTVLLIDDVQWLDEGTLEILRQLSKLLTSTPLLLATTARNDSESHSLALRFLDSVHAARPLCINLEPLGDAAIGELVSTHLGSRPLAAASLQVIARKVNGNPFAVGEYVRLLLDRGALLPTEREWILNDEIVRQLALPDDVAQLLIDRMTTLAPATVKVLGLASVIGFQFDIDTLSAAAGGSENVARALTEGLESALIEKTENGYGFVHDRLSEAFIKRLSDQELKDAHEKIANVIEQLGSPDPQALYALARHCARGNSERNPARVYQTNLRAGLAALESFSNDESIEFLKRALACTAQTASTIQDLRLIHEGIGLAYTRSGHHGDAKLHLQSALNHVSSTFDRARIHYLLGLASASAGEHSDARRSLNKALTYLDIYTPRTPLGAILSILFHGLAAECRIRTRIGFGRARGNERRRRELISKINSVMNYICYMQGDQLMMAESAIREIHNVQALGICAETAKAHSNYSSLLSFLLLKNAADHHSLYASRIARQIGNQETIAYCDLISAFGMEIRGEMQRSYLAILEAYPRIVRYCTAWDKSMMIGHRTHMLVAGKFRETLSWMLQTMPVLQGTGDQAMAHIVYSNIAICQQALGNKTEAVKAIQIANDLDGNSAASPFGRSFHKVALVKLLYFLDDYGPETDRLIGEMLQQTLPLYHTRDRFSVVALIRIEQYRRSTSAAERKKHLREIRKMIARAGFPNAVTAIHTSLRHVVRGAYFSLLGKFIRAEREFSRAAAAANGCENLLVDWLVARERARAARAQGLRAVEDAEALTALKVAEENGLENFAAKIRNEFHYVLNKNIQSSNVKTETSPKGDPGTNAHIMLANRKAQLLMQIALASAMSLDPDRQARAILDELIAILGAERAFLFEDSSNCPGGLVMRAGRGSGKNDIPALMGYSSTVVDRVWRDRKPLIVSGTDEGEVLGAQSIVAHNLRSVMAVPVAFRDKNIGVLYVDSTLAKGIFTEDDLDIATALGNHIAVALEMARSARLEIENMAMRKNLEVTNAVQSLTLPKKNAVALDGIRLASYFKPAEQSGGDWWWYEFDQNTQVMRVLMGDVTGHGAGPAMISAAVSASYQTFRRLRESHQGDLADFMQILNATLFELAEEKYLISMNALEIDLGTGRCDYWAAGAPPILIVRSSGKTNCLMATGSWLGSKEFAIGHECIELHPGDRVAIFTDGLFELKISASGRELGLRRLEKLLVQSREQELAEALESVRGQIAKLHVPTSHDDDISFVLLELQDRNVALRAEPDF